MRYLLILFVLPVGIVILGLGTLIMAAHAIAGPLPPEIGFMNRSCHPNFCQRGAEVTDIFQISLDGLPLRRLTLNPEYEYNAVWSPDGAWVIFSRQRGGHAQVFRVPVRSRREQQLTSCEGNNLYPDISPDGEWIVYESTCGMEGSRKVLIRSRVDGSQRQQVTPADLYVIGFQRWSPDGEWIIFVGFDGNDQEIYRVRPDGTALQNLTDNNDHDTFPTWSPDSEWIVYLNGADDNATPPYRYYWGRTQIRRMRADGSDVLQLTDWSPGAISPDVSPDGAWVVYVRPNASEEIRKVRMDGSEDVVLGDHGWLPQWSPSGDRIVYLSRGRSRLAVMSADGQSTQELHDWLGMDSRPQWVAAPDPPLHAGRLLGVGLVLIAVPLGAMLWQGLR